MATGFTISMETPEWCICQVCWNDMFQLSPRLLNCHHTFCESCLRNLIEGHNITCPICRITTKVPRGDITNLNKDFRILQMKEYFEKVTEHQLITRPQRKSQTCQVCKKSEPVNMCETCNKLICETCRNKHGKIKLFMNHNIQKLCPKHPECGISHICLMCVESVCASCILVDHSDHEDQIQIYDEGIQNLMNMFRVLFSEISQMRKVSLEEKEREKAKKLTISQTRRKLELARQEIDEKLKNIIHAELNTSKRMETCENQLSKYNEMFEHLSVLQEDVSQGIIHDDYKIIPEIMTELNLDIHLFSSVAEPKVHQFEVTTEPTFQPAGPIAKTKFHQPQNICASHVDNWLKAPKLIFKLENSSKYEMVMPGSVTCMADGDILFVDKELSQITKIQRVSEVTSKVKTNQAMGKVITIHLFADFLYVGQEKCITKWYQSDPDQVIEEYHLDVTDIYDFDVVNEEMCIITTNGGVYEYKTANQSSKQALDVKDETNGTYVCCTTCDDGPRCILSLSGLCRVEIYNKEWQLLTTIKRCGSRTLYYPKSICVSPGGMLVADSNNHRVLFFSLDGQLKQEILNENHGLKYPRALCYKAPLLWVTEYSRFLPCKIKCFIVSE